MVKLKYSALYTDNLGCEQAAVYFFNGEFELKVRGCTFKNDSLNFDFHARNFNKVKHLFYLKDDELIEYIVDIKIPLTLSYNNKECIQEFLLRIERHKNYYCNSLSFCSSDGIVYKVEGYDLHELFINMNKELPKEYDMEWDFSCMRGERYIETNKEKDFEEKWKAKSNEVSYLKLFNSKYKKEFKKLQKVPITYICDEYCLS